MYWKLFEYCVGNQIRMHCFDINEELIVLERMDDEEDDYDLWDYETDPEDEVPDDHLLDHTLPDPAESDRLNVICIQADEVVNEMNREIEKAKNVIEVISILSK